MVCRTHEPGLQTQCLGIYPLQFPVRSIYPEPFERFSLNFTQMFLFVRRCAEHMAQLCSLKVNVTVQGRRIYPWSWYLLHIRTIFVKLYSILPLSETMCRTYDSTTLTQGQEYTSMLWDTAAGDLDVIQIAVLFKLCSLCQKWPAPVHTHIGENQNIWNHKAYILDIW